MKAFLKKFIGTGDTSNSCFSTYYNTGVVGFACGGIFSILNYKKQSRTDFVIQEDLREITALSFAREDEGVILGERGPDARLFVLSFKKNFSGIISKIEIKTKENGFSHVRILPNLRLISVSNDPQPFLLVWDMNRATPAVIGYYHLPRIPTDVAISSDGNLAVVTGEKMLKFFNLNLIDSNAERAQVLTVHNLYTKRLKTEKFMSATISPVEPYDALCLSQEGSIIIFEKAGKIYTEKSKLKAPISIIPIHLGHGNTSCIAMDNKMIAVGTESGSILAIRKEGKGYNIFGKYSQQNKKVVSIGLSKKTVSASYSDGSIIVWQRRLNAPPSMSIVAHSGPVTSLISGSSDSNIITGGSDGTVRIWEVSNDEDKPQGELLSKQISKRPDDFSTAITGIRCLTKVDKFILAGDCFGVLHVLMKDSLAEIQNLRITNQPITAIAASNKIAAIGTEVGKIFSYDVTLTGLIMKATAKLHSSIITALAITEDSIISAGSDGVKIHDTTLHTKFSVEGETITLCLMPNQKAVVAGLINGKINYITLDNGKVFRSHLLDMDSYPVKLKVEPTTGFYIIVCMSDGTVRLVDTYSGGVLPPLPFKTGLVTDIAFIGKDFAISSFNGYCSVWEVPIVDQLMLQQNQHANEEVTQQPNAEKPLHKEENTFANQPSIRTSIVRNSIAHGSFEEVQTNLENNETVMEPIPEEDEKKEEEEQQPDTTAFDDIQKGARSSYDNHIDNIVRASFVKRDNQTNIQMVAAKLQYIYNKAKEIIDKPPQNCETEVAELNKSIEAARNSIYQQEWFKQMLHQKVDDFLASKNGH